MNEMVRQGSVAPGAAPIAIERVVKKLGGHRVLDGVDIDLEAGTFFTLVGDPQSVVATWEPSGRLSLESRNLDQTLSVARYLLGASPTITRKSEVN